MATTEERTKFFEENRRHTNVGCAWVSVFFIIIWFIATIYVLATIPYETVSLSHSSYTSTMNSISLTVSRNITPMLIFTFFYVLIVLIYILLLREALAKVVAVICLFVDTILLLLTIIGILGFIFTAMTAVSGFNIFLMILIILIVVLVLIYEAFILISAYKVGVRFIGQVVAESRRAIFHDKSIILFTIILFLLSMGIFAMAFAAAIRLENADQPFLSSICKLFTFVYPFIIYFGQMVISDSVAFWYWTMDKNTISTSIQRSTGRTLRNHLGTIGFASTGILPFINAIYLAFIWSRNHAKKYEYGFLRFICKVHLIFHVTEYALIQTSIHGYNYCRSSRKTFDLALQNCSKFLGVTTMACNVIMFILSISTGIVLVFLYSTVNTSGNLESGFVIALLLIIFYGFVAPLCWMLCIAAKTILLCILEDIEENNGTIEKPYYMHHKLQGILVRSNML